MPALGSAVRGRQLWLQAICLCIQNNNDISALSLKRRLGVACAAGWRVNHELVEAMRQREMRRMLNGVLFADDAVLGGEHACKRGRHRDMASSMATVEPDDNDLPQYVRFDTMSN